MFWEKNEIKSLWSDAEIGPWFLLYTKENKIDMCFYINCDI